MKIENSIVFADDLLGSVENGTKNITIRKNFREYIIGMSIPVYSPTGVQQEYNISPERVTWCLAKDVRESELVADGFASHYEMYEGMASFYPGFGPDTPVTVLEFGLVK
jgi:hypothetical protein